MISYEILIYTVTDTIRIPTHIVIDIYVNNNNSNWYCNFNHEWLNYLIDISNYHTPSKGWKKISYKCINSKTTCLSVFFIDCKKCNIRKIGKIKKILKFDRSDNTERWRPHKLT